MERPPKSAGCLRIERHKSFPADLPESAEKEVAILDHIREKKVLFSLLAGL